MRSTKSAEVIVIRRDKMMKCPKCGAVILPKKGDKFILIRRSRIHAEFILAIDIDMQKMKTIKAEAICPICGGVLKEIKKDNNSG